jgi:hypothetical protein
VRSRWPGDEATPGGWARRRQRSGKVVLVATVVCVARRRWRCGKIEVWA